MKFLVACLGTLVISAAAFAQQGMTLDPEPPAAPPKVVHTPRAPALPPAEKARLPMYGGDVVRFRDADPEGQHITIRVNQEEDPPVPSSPPRTGGRVRGTKHAHSSGHQVPPTKKTPLPSTPVAPATTSAIPPLEHSGLYMPDNSDQNSPQWVASWVVTIAAILLSVAVIAGTLAYGKHRLSQARARLRRASRRHP